MSYESLENFFRNFCIRWLSSRNFAVQASAVVGPAQNIGPTIFPFWSFRTMPNKTCRYFGIEKFLTKSPLMGPLIVVMRYSQLINSVWLWLLLTFLKLELKCRPCLAFRSILVLPHFATISSFNVISSLTWHLSQKIVGRHCHGTKRALLANRIRTIMHSAALNHMSFMLCTGSHTLPLARFKYVTAGYKTVCRNSQPCFWTNNTRWISRQDLRLELSWASDNRLHGRVYRFSTATIKRT